MRDILKDRLKNFYVSLLCFGAPALAYFLDSGTAGIHGYLKGLPSCAFKSLTGTPCPFCGMTTCFSAMSHFRVREAVWIQPAGALIYLLCLIAGFFFIGRGLLGRPFIDLRKGKYWKPVFNLLLSLIGIVWLCRFILLVTVYG